MKQEDLLKYKAELFKYTDSLTKSKGKGYGSEEDSLANLKLSEIVGVCPTEIGVYTRLLDKVYRLGRLLVRDDIPHEGVVDTVADLINYAVYILAILEEKGKLRLKDVLQNRE